MGADLIGYFAIGPEKISEQNITKALEQCAPMAEWVEKVRQAAETDLDDRTEDVLDELVSSSPVGLGEGFDVDDLACTFAPLCGLSEEDLESLIHEFVNNWPHLGRDCSFIHDPDEPEAVIVFCGELSWGDSPGGIGFRTLEAIALLGVAAYLAVFISGAFDRVRIRG